MTGSGPAFILIPITGTIFLITWLILVFLADSRSQRARDESAPGRKGPATAVLADRRQLDARPVAPADLVPAVPFQDAAAGTRPAADGLRLLRQPAESGHAVPAGPAKPAA